MNYSKHLLDEYGVDLVTSDLKLEVDGGVVVPHEGSSPWPDGEKELLWFCPYWRGVAGDTGAEAGPSSRLCAMPWCHTMDCLCRK